jgi:hypothetical protein
VARSSSDYVAQYAAAFKKLSFAVGSPKWGRMLLEEELFAEHIEQLMLVEALVKAPPLKISNLTHIIGNVCRNLQMYFNSQRVWLPPTADKYLCQLLEVIFHKTKASVISAIYHKIFDLQREAQGSFLL